MSHGFFTIISRTEFETLLRTFPPLGEETVDLALASGRVLAQNLTAAHDWPLLDRSCMDGFAINARDVFGAGESNPGYLECVASLSIDQLPDIALNPGECARISTGGVLPEGADSVIMVEHTLAMQEDAGNGTIEIRKSVAPGEKRHAARRRRQGQCRCPACRNNHAAPGNRTGSRPGFRTAFPDSQTQSRHPFHRRRTDRGRSDSQAGPGPGREHPYRGRLGRTGGRHSHPIRYRQG